MNAISQQNSPVEIDGKKYLRNGEGHLVPLELAKAEHVLEDELVRKIIGHAYDLSAQIARFKGYTASDLATFQALLQEKYKARAGGVKGNVTFHSYDGLMKVQLRMADNLVFGAELQVAKKLIDECLNEWAADANAPIRAIINKAFSVDQEGHINRQAILGLRSLDIDDQRWKDAMEAISASIRIMGTKAYFRFYHRASLTADWNAITIDIASAEAPAGEVQ
jgi:hypothetical protein